MSNLSVDEVRSATVYRATVSRIAVPGAVSVTVSIMIEDMQLGERMAFSVVAICGETVYRPGVIEVFEDAYRSFCILREVVTATTEPLSNRLVQDCARASRLRDASSIDQSVVRRLVALIGQDRFDQLRNMDFGDMPPRIRDMWVRCR